MIVVDASALIAFFLREEGWCDLTRYMKMTVSVDHVVKELYNAVWKATCIKRLIDCNEAKRIIVLFKRYREANMIIEPEDKYMDSALEIALQEGLTIYDSIYIAQAYQTSKPLLTLDEKQRRVAEKMGLKIIP